MGRDSNTTAVIALDAADYRLAKAWNCQNILLDNNRELETFSYSGDDPVTLEVWTTVATGVHPEVHGMVSTGEQQEWDNPLFRVAGNITPYLLPKWARVHLGTMLQGDTNDMGMTFDQTDHDHCFPENGAYCWPGITPANHLSQTWHWLNLAEQGEITEAELWQRLYANMGKELGWVMSMAQTELTVVGVHMHILDAAGHIYANSEENLKEVYRRVDSMLGTVRDAVGELVVLSDHGMQVGMFPEDDQPGDHSWRAMFATTEDGNCPESVFEVREWLESRRETQQSPTDVASLDTTRDQLDDLGYL